MPSTQAVGSPTDGGARSDDPFPEVDGFLSHPRIAPRTIEARRYQKEAAAQARRRNVLLVMPTGLGKTIVAVLAVAHVLHEGSGKVLFMAPTRPLADQHAASLNKLLSDPVSIRLFSGQMPPASRAKAWRTTEVVVATPQTVRNDLAAGRYDLSDVALVVFDEAHHAVGDYAYVDVAQRLRFESPRARIIGLTASPGADARRLAEVQQALGIQATRSMTEDHPSVSEYVADVGIEWVPVELDARMRRIRAQLEGVLDSRVATLRKLRLVPENRSYGASKKELVQITQRLGRSASGGDRRPQVFAGLLAAQAAMYANNALELLETQGLVPLHRSLKRMSEKKDRKRAEAAFLSDPKVAAVLDWLDRDLDSSHPKVDVLVQALTRLAKTTDAPRSIVFAQFRDTVESIVDDLRKAGFSAERFVGQGASGGAAGLTQKEQREILDRFRAGVFNVLVSTSVGEEGIDVPQVDLVVFFEAVPSEIRAIQRRGRTGRTRAGHVIVLVTKDSRDEAYMRTQLGKEKRMRRLIEQSD